MTEPDPDKPYARAPEQKITVESVASVPGSGAGTKLIAQVAAIADDRYVPIVLESSTENDAYYRGLGFDVDSNGMYVLSPIKARALARRAGIRQEDPSKEFVVLEDTGRPGDGHVKTEDGARLWGKYGASGVMIRNVASDGTERFLLVQRGKSVSSNRWKWQLPGGAIDSDENDYQGAARELSEELEPPQNFLSGVKARGEVKFTHPSGWHYTNISADSDEMFDPKVDGSETNDAQWFTRDEIAELPLQPAFRDNINNLMDQFGSPHVDLPEEPVEPDLEFWEPERFRETEQDEGAESLWETYYSDEALDLEESREELLERLDEFERSAAEARDRGDTMEQFLWQSRYDHLKSQIESSEEEPDNVLNRAEEAPASMTPPTVDSISDLVKRSEEDVVHSTALGYRGDRSPTVASVREVVPTAFQGETVPEPAAGEPGNALSDPEVRGGKGNLYGGYSFKQRVIYDGQIYTVLQNGGRHGTIKINYTDRGMDVMLSDLFPVEGSSTPTAHLPADVSGASAMSLDILGFSKQRRKLLDRLIKNDRITLDNQTNTGPGSSRALAELTVLKQQGLQSAAASFGFTEAETRSAIYALNEALADWSMRGELRESRLKLHDAMRSLRAGSEPSSALERGLLLQKAWASAVWKQKYGDVDTVRAARVVSGEYADRMRIMDEAVSDSSGARRDRATWELTQYEMTSWAVPEARDRLVRNWLRDQRGAVMEKEFSRDEAWLLVWGEPGFRSWGLKAPGEIIVDDRTPLTRESLDVEYTWGADFSTAERTDGEQIRSYSAWLRVMPQLTVEDLAIARMLVGQNWSGSGRERFDIARSFIFNKHDPSEFLDTMQKSQLDQVSVGMKLAAEKEETGRDLSKWRQEQLEEIEKSVPHTSKLLNMIASSDVSSTQYQVESDALLRVMDASYNLYYLRKNLLPGFTYSVKTRAAAEEKLNEELGIYSRVEDQSRNAIVALWMKRGMSQTEAEEHYRELTRRLTSFMDTIDTTGLHVRPKSLDDFPEEAP